LYGALSSDHAFRGFLNREAAVEFLIVPQDAVDLFDPIVAALEFEIELL
jgi:hypothetical protein